MNSKNKFLSEKVEKKVFVPVNRTSAEANLVITFVCVCKKHRA